MTNSQWIFNPTLYKLFQKMEKLEIIHNSSSEIIAKLKIKSEMESKTKENYRSLSYEH